MYALMYTCMHVYMYDTCGHQSSGHIQTYTYTHIHTHTHTHTHLQPPVVVGDLKDGASNVEVKRLLNCRLVRVANNSLPLAVRRALE